MFPSSKGYLVLVIFAVVIILAFIVYTMSIRWRVLKLKEKLTGRNRTAFVYEYKNTSNMLESITVIRHYEEIVKKRRKKENA